jgi:DtxR family Mn-dependent transcriptional regulator
MLSLTVENYLKAIKQISQQSGVEFVSPGDVVSALKVAPGTVTSMLKSLADAKLAEYKPYTGVKLTPEGEILAIRLIRRHRLIEQFLVQTLNMDWDEVHAEAENMEHAMSDSLIDRIDEFLGRPATDPHGDPIPAADGSLRVSTSSFVRLSECPAGTHFRIARVVDQAPDFLRTVADLGLQIGSKGVITEFQKNQYLTISLDGKEIRINHDVSSQIMVENQSAPVAIEQ